MTAFEKFMNLTIPDPEEREAFLWALAGIARLSIPGQDIIQSLPAHDPEANAYKKILFQCAAVFQKLADEHHECSRQASGFYHARMAMKAAQTYKHCASCLLTVAASLPPSLLDWPDDSPLTADPIQGIPLRTYRHRRPPLRELRMIRAVSHRYRAASGRFRLGRGGLKRCRTLICRGTS